MTAPASVTEALDRLERLENAATPAPWVHLGEFEPIIHVTPEGYQAELFECGEDCCVPDDAAVIVAARNAIPALIRIARAALAVHAADAATDSADPDLAAALDALPEAMRG